ncbi:MAG: HD-GYP domain-containing protein, partial [Candidatus Adiutrix sp.]
RHVIRLHADYPLKSLLLLAPFEHHLGIDLKGYPQSSRQAPLSLFGRILTVADHYDAMTSNRSYRKEPISPDMALKLMIRYSGTKFDPLILKVFIGMMGVYPIGTLVVLDTKEIALVLSTPKNAKVDRPLVVLLNKNPSGGGVTKGAQIDLSEREATGRKYKRSIVRCFHPADYGLNVSDFLDD